MLDNKSDDVKISIEDLRNSGWKQSLSSCDRLGYFSMASCLSSAAENAKQNGNIPTAKALLLIGSACSMVLRPESSNEPFVPHMVLADGRRTTLPQDFQESDVDLFFQFSEEIDDVWLKARLADIVWLLKSPRSFKHAIMAIDLLRTELWGCRGRPISHLSLARTWLF